MPKKILTNAFYTGSPAQTWAGLWCHPDSNGLGYADLEFWTDLARIAESGLIDGIFLADALGVMDRYEGKPDAVIRSGALFPCNDPMMPITAMAAVTKNLCFGVTANTSYEPPYLLARRFSTLDHLTKGRVAWNIVTGHIPSTAAALGIQPVPHDKRYDIADEYMDLMYKLWEASWDDDAAVHDKSRRMFADPSGIRKISHSSEHFLSHGLHLCEPSLQRTPYLYAAGASGRGVAFAGKHAEAAFMSANSKSYAKHVVDGYRKAAAAAGRDPDSVKVFNAATIIVAPTEAEARDLEREYTEYSDAHGNLAVLSAILGIDLSKYELDDPIEYVESDAIQSLVEAMTIYNQGEPVRVGDIARFSGIAGREAYIVGSTQQVCDTLVEWVEETGVDGFNLVRTVEPAGLQSFIDLVIPELQNRGYYKTEYAEGTMREKLGSGSGPQLASEHYGAGFRHVPG